ncbi:hypothetical protein GLO37_26075, partial [Escherichia coli]|nr:hypothetical protein [Escherichia coli]
MATPRDQCHQHLASQPRERVVALERHSICKLIFTPRPSRSAYEALRLHFEEHLPRIVAGRRLGVPKS